MAKPQIEEVWEVEDLKIPVRIFIEYRRNARVSMRGSGVIIRLPAFMTGAQKEAQIMHFKSWAFKQIKKNNPLAQHYVEREYTDGQTVEVGATSYLLRIFPSDLMHHHGEIIGKEIHLRLAEGADEKNRKKAIRHLLSRLVAIDRLPDIQRRVAELNHQYFQKPIKSVKLKLNKSNWGSCSNKGNINLSTRLLFAPEEVIDYVIIHELAHLIEANHSHRFWKLVEDAMPDYKEKEKWLKINGAKCDF